VYNISCFDTHLRQKNKHEKKYFVFTSSDRVTWLRHGLDLMVERPERQTVTHAVPIPENSLTSLHCKNEL